MDESPPARASHQDASPSPASAACKSVLKAQRFAGFPLIAKDSPVQKLFASLTTIILTGALFILPGSVTRWAIHMHLVSQQTGIQPEVLACVILHESRGNPNAVSPKGAVGLMQIRPLQGRPSHQELLDPYINLHTGADYLPHLLQRNNGDLFQALLDYNAGPYRDTIPWHSRAFAEAVTQCVVTLQEHPEYRAFTSPAPPPQSL